MRVFGRHNKLNDFAEAIRPELIRMPVPQARSELFDRIMSSRASGTRVILPDAVQRSAVIHRSRFLLAAAAAAGLLLVLVPLRAPRHDPIATGDASSMSRIATEWLPGSVASAQGSTPARRFSPVHFAQPERIHPMRLVYRRTWRDSANKVIDRIDGVTTVERMMRGNTPELLIVARNEGSRAGKSLLKIDSVEISRDNLRMLRQASLERPYSRYDDIRIEHVFRGDSVVGVMRATQKGVITARRPIARKLPSSAGPYLADAIAPILLGATNLRSGWSGSASILGWAVRDDDVFTPIELRVERDDVITVPAGRFDCWLVSIRVDRRTVAYWVRKSDGVGVRALERETSGNTREVVLMSAQTRP